MDICSLSMFNISLKERIQNFYLNPYNFVFMHWLSGLIYLYCFLPVLNVFHKVARPGIFWSSETILINYNEFSGFIQVLYYTMYINNWTLTFIYFLFLYLGSCRTKIILSQSKSDCFDHNIWNSYHFFSVDANTNS